MGHWRPDQHRLGVGLAGLMAALSLSTALPAQAQSWTGATDSDWFTGTNWNPNGAPGNSSLVVIDSTTNAPVINKAGATAADVQIGAVQGKTGSLTVTGNGALSVPGGSGKYFFVGGAGNGSLTVSAGGQVTSGAQLYVAEGTGGSGTGSMLITGAGSKVSANAGVFVGSDVGAIGTITVEKGGVLIGTVSLGNYPPNSKGTLNVDGVGSTVTAGNELRVGYKGEGILNISNGAAVTASSGSVSGSLTGKGAITVSTNGSLAVSQMDIGIGAAGTMTVESGGDYSGTTLLIGSTAKGTVTLKGTGSTLGTTGSTQVGANAAGELTISDGATATARRGRIGVTAVTGTGTVTVTGAGSRWDINHVTDGDLIIGEGGKGTLNIENGGVVHAKSGVIGYSTGVNGTLKVSGAGSELIIDTSLRVGLADNILPTASISILDGGKITVGGGKISDYLTVSNSTTFLIDGAGSKLTITQGEIVGNNSTPSYLRMGNAGTNTLTVSNGGAVDIDRADFVAKTGASIAVSVSGGTSTWSSKVVEVGGAGTASFTVSNGATVTSAIKDDFYAGFLVKGTGTATPVLTVSSGGKIVDNGNLRIGSDGKGSLVVDTGGQIDARLIDVAQGLTKDSDGSVTITDSGTKVETDNLQIGLSGGGKGSVTVQNKASLATGFTSIGGFLAGKASLTVTGDGTKWSASSNISVYAFGDLTIDKKASLTGDTAVSLRVANRATITDAGTIVSAVDLSVSADDPGPTTAVVDILAGAVFGGRSGTIGVDGAGEVNVDGKGSQWNASGTIRVGIGGTGLLDITNGGAVTSLNGYLGTALADCSCSPNPGGGTGTVNITGIGASWALTDTVRVGDYSAGNLNITAGATMSSATAIIGRQTGSIGTVVVDGAGSSWTNSGTFAIGELGTGTLTVTAGSSVSSSGAATIGTLGTLNIGSGAIAGSFSAASIDNAGLVRFNHTGSVTFATAITGIGALTRDAAGTTILTGANAYSGTTTINAGILQIGNGGATGDIGSGSIVNNAALVIDRTGSVTIAGDMSGSGSFEKKGGGTAIVTGAFSHTGTTTVTAGTLQIGNGTTGSIGGDIGNAGTLAFNRSNALTYGGVISGAGTLHQNGAGTTTLTATSTYTGATTVTAGALSVNGDIRTSSLLTVGANGTLMGTGWVGPTSVAGTIAPGNSIGTLHVDGNYVQQAGSTYVVEINATPAADLILIDNGTATIEAGATMVVEAAPGSYPLTDRYTVMTAELGVSGTFTLDEDTPFLDMSLDYDAYNVYLDIARTAVDFTDVADTPNQMATAAALESLDPGDTLPAAIVPLSEAAARDAFDQLSGEIHADMARVLVADSRLPREAALDRVEAAFAAIEAGQRRQDVADFWIRGVGDTGVIRSDGNAAAIGFGSGGLMLGADGLVGDDVLVGIEAGISRHAIDVDDRSSTATASGYHLGIYAGAELDALRLKVGASISGYGVYVEREPSFTGFTDSLTADYFATTVQAFGEVGYEIALDDKSSIEPFLRVAIVGHSASGYSESGGAAALSGHVDPNLSVVAMLGLAGSTEFTLGDGQVVEVRGRIGWEQQFGPAPTATHAFAGSDPFTVASQGYGSGSIAAEASVGTQINDVTRLDFGIKGTLGESGARGAVTLTLSGRF